MMKNFSENGAEFFSDKEKIIKDSDILLQLNLPDEKDLKNLSPNKNLIGVFDPKIIKIVFQNFLKIILMFFH